MLMRICQHCGRQIRQGEKCQCVKTERRASHDLYDSTMWQKIAKAARQRAQYLDEVELASGRIVEGRIVHHIYMVDERPDLTLSLSNLIVVSKKTHELIHQSYNRGGEALRSMREKLLRIRQGDGRSV